MLYFFIFISFTGLIAIHCALLQFMHPAFQWSFGVLLQVSYWLCLEYALLQDGVHWRWLRSSPLARFLHPYFSKGWLNRDVIVELAKHRTERHYWFALEPHGPASFNIVCGFAAHGERDSELATMLDNTRVVAHWSHRLLPLVRDLFAAAGCTSSARVHVDAVIKRRQHIVMTPSGLDGCVGAMLEPNGAHPDHVIVYRNKSASLGYLSLATRHHMHLVPVLAYSQRAAWHLWPGWVAQRWPTWALYLKTDQRISYECGAPIDTSAYDHTSNESMHALADRYYDALSAMGNARGVQVRIVARRDAADK